jgi:15-cis-phytoene desaturase
VSGPSVAVFGAGIAGLTAAHELAERGFRVVVHERASEAGAGGMAASQWHTSTRLHDTRTGQPLRLPGEHGFRVFQSYYRHCEDTMKRIPGDGRPRVFDHLVNTYKTGHAIDDGVRPWAFDRRRPRSLAGAFQFGLVLMHGLGWELRDYSRLGLKIAQHMTSSSARRLGEYERQSLWEYFDVPRFSARAQRHLASLYRLLLAMDLRRADARTQNNIAVRVAMEQMGEGAPIDRVLDGPTSERWFRPWIGHLREQGVVFCFDSELRRFEIADGAVVAAVVGSTGGPGEQRCEADYYVSDLPVGPLARVIARSDALVECDAEETARQPASLNPDAPLRHVLHMSEAPEFRGWMSGMQFYLSEDVRVLAGHQQLLDSEWGLSLVSQPQFWGPDFSRRYGGGQVRGLLSVDICDFERPGRLVRKPARACTADEMAREIWQQLADALWRGGTAGTAPSGAALLPPPYLDHHVDDLMIRDPRTGVIRENIAPYFITPPSSWWRRPGPLPAPVQCEDGYRVRLGQLVVVGAFTQTYTGLTTMEAANESGRHGVNGILTDVEKRAGLRRGSRYERCTIWPLELDEPADLDPWKAIDERLFKQGKPHAFELLGFEQLLDQALPRGLGIPMRAPLDIDADAGRFFDDLRARLMMFERSDPF